jgi:hypothetical protein
MPPIGGTRALYSAQRQFKTDLNLYFKDITTYATGLLVGAADANDIIDPQRLPALKADIGDRVQRVFHRPNESAGIGPGGRPLAPYGHLLTKWISYGVASVVDAHAVQMRRDLPEDLQRWLLNSPTTESVAEAANPFAQYEPPHLWVDPSGHQLSERIWKVGFQTRLKVDALLSDGIRSGRSARTLAKELEQFLLPNRKALRTKKPYGSDASYDAMRLARSEIARAHGQASKIAAIANPFVTGLDWCLSAKHPRFDICDGLATIGMGGERLKDPYPPESAPVPVQSSHPNCLCHTRAFVTASRAEVVADLRAQMEQGGPAPLTPLNMRGMLIKLLGGYLAGEALRTLAA